MRVVAFPDAPRFAVGAAEEIAASVRRYPAELRMSLGLAGGSTPRPVYEALRGMDLPWDRVELWLSDERWVAPDHPDSNGRMAAEVLADDVSATLHRPPWSETMEPADAAADYEATLHELMPDGRPHLVLLGMGDDGHTASLFPDSDALDAPESRWVVATRVEAHRAWRLTATAHLLRRAREVFVLVAGERKAEMLREVLEGTDGRYPVQLVRRCEGEVTWLVDDGAASRLEVTDVDRPDTDESSAS